ncbi:helix-turn-helix domain-containing protein [Desulfofundulus thermobenzoicus]|uniref:Helix-turn-helix domain-containing protein n=1 Tax=Desulfofundulus thermobenzoicus TaxID=29376 RepID=A0A6N7ITP1_9FIRM|nr:helix-turn-helix domain-containing protein [Desulfofundulus thermobenzoicus]MQL53422.1 helix-turn-helix domain-containing protein [Desulfofundulus thermobenzoicus]
MTKEELRKTWEERVAAFKASGQTASAWCAAHDLKPHQLFYWLRKYKNNASAPATAPSQWLTMEIDKQNPDSAQGDSLLIRLGQATIEVKAGFNPILLSDVVRILAGIC